MSAARALVLARSAAAAVPIRKRRRANLFETTDRLRMVFPLSSLGQLKCTIKAVGIQWHYPTRRVVDIKALIRPEAGAHGRLWAPRPPAAGRISRPFGPASRSMSRASAAILPRPARGSQHLREQAEAELRGRRQAVQKWTHLKAA